MVRIQTFTSINKSRFDRFKITSELIAAKLEIQKLHKYEFYQTLNKIRK